MKQGGRNMSKIFVIPDVHLKIDMIKKADELFSMGDYDHALFLGDIPDDWDEQQNIPLYRETFEAVCEFLMKHPDTYFCYGNHDMSYVWGQPETGYSYQARDTVLEGLDNIKEILPEENLGYIHKIDNVLFSHGGLIKDFVDKYCLQKYDIDEMISEINRFGCNEMWNDYSPIWARPQYDPSSLYSDYLQAVGHTPMKIPEIEGNLLSLDTFSTDYLGRNIGTCSFVCVDTENKEWHDIDN